MVEAVGRTFIGVDKAVNQDAFAALSCATGAGDAALAVVCDGVGGLASGDIASVAVVREFSRWFTHGLDECAFHGRGPDSAGLEAVAPAWAELLAGINRRMWDYGLRLNVRMGTTCTALLLCSGSYLCCQVGDGRAYRLGRGGFARLTSDQTLIQREVDAGRIAAREALTHPGGRAVTQAVGAQETLAPVFSSGEYGAGDVFLVCSDGLYRHLGDGRVELGIACARRAAGEGELAGALDSMIAHAVDAGETDNITGALLCVSTPAGA